MENIASRISSALVELDSKRYMLEENRLDYLEEEITDRINRCDEDGLIDFGKDLDVCTYAIEAMISTLKSIKDDVEELQMFVDEELTNGYGETEEDFYREAI